jgi:hypothetical protein
MLQMIYYLEDIKIYSDLKFFFLVSEYSSLICIQCLVVLFGVVVFAVSLPFLLVFTFLSGMVRFLLGLGGEGRLILLGGVSA